MWIDQSNFTYTSIKHSVALVLNREHTQVHLIDQDETLRQQHSQVWDICVEQLKLLHNHNNNSVTMLTVVRIFRQPGNPFQTRQER